MNSPVTGKTMELLKEKRTIEFRKEPFEQIFHYYRCTDSGMELEDERLLDLNLDQVYNAYRSKHKLPFAEDIKQIRIQYDLPATTMSEILGFGVNQYRLYETGDIPSETNARLIQMAADPNEFLRLIELSGAVDGKVKEKLLTRIAALKEKITAWNTVRERMLGIHLPNEYNGYRKTSPEKAYHQVRFFADNLHPTKTALNKFLFYSDFYHYKQFGMGISGLQYRAIQWGPVPSQFDYLFNMAEENGVINLKYEVWNGDKEMVIIDPAPGTPFKKELFTDEEIKSMEAVAKTLKKLKTNQLVDISHNELAWKENIEGKKLISYQYAFELMAL